MTFIRLECYVFDFAMDQALKQIYDYSCCLNINEGTPGKKVAEFISFLPVIAYDGSSIRQISICEVLTSLWLGFPPPTGEKVGESIPTQPLFLHLDLFCSSRLPRQTLLAEPLLKAVLL
ncbi:hypothetical protein D1641_09110 [Colidextribacter sp. OB.20]|nr:hypothetical protein [Colidextribacter sp. OB.20]